MSLNVYLFADEIDLKLRLKDLRVFSQEMNDTSWLKLYGFNTPWCQYQCDISKWK